MRIFTFNSLLIFSILFSYIKNQVSRGYTCDNVNSGMKIVRNIIKILI